MKKSVNFWIGREKIAKLPRAFVEGVVFVFLRIVFVLFLRRTGRRENHKKNQASEYQADPEQNEHKGMARHEIKNPGDKPNGKDYRNQTTANLKSLLRLLLNEYEEKGYTKRQSKKRRHIQTLLNDRSRHDFSQVLIRSTRKRKRGCKQKEWKDFVHGASLLLKYRYVLGENHH